MKFPRSLPALGLACLFLSLDEARSNPDLESNESFIAALKDVTFETSFTSKERVRFYADKLEVLDSKGKVVRGGGDVTIVEPGIFRLDYSDGGSQWYLFSEDLQTFAIANMKQTYELGDVAPGAAIPSEAGGQPLTFSVSGHPRWKSLSVESGKVVPVSAAGASEAPLEGVRFYSNALGVLSPEKGASFLVLSRTEPKGWWLEGLHIGSGIRTQLAGVFSASLSSPLKGFSERTTQFNKALLRGHRFEEASAQEAYSEFYLRSHYGETSPLTIHGLMEMGLLRRYALSTEKAVEWQKKSYELAKQHLSADPEELFANGSEYGETVSDNGQFAEAVEIFAELQPLAEKIGVDPTKLYDYHRTLGEAEFGRRNYAEAASWFQKNVDANSSDERRGYRINSLIDLVPCQVAAGNRDQGLATLRQAIELQDKRQADNPKSTYDMYHLAFACVAMEQWDDALRFGRKTDRRSSVLYREYAHLMALWNMGNREEATQYAREIAGRFDDLEDIQIRRDRDAMAVSLTNALASSSRDASQAFAAEWAEQKEKLRMRPHANYLFAMGMVQAMKLMP